MFLWNNVVNYSDWFGDVRLILHSWDKVHLACKKKLFIQLVVCLVNFVNFATTFISTRDLWGDFVFCFVFKSFVWFWYLMGTSLIVWMWVPLFSFSRKIFSELYFFLSFKDNCPAIHTDLRYIVALLMKSFITMKSMQ